MLEPAIQSFLDERKDAWLKKNINNNTTEEHKVQFQQQAREKFSLAGWLPSATKRASQLFIVSHPGKFSHPSAKTSSVIALGNRKADGYLRTGNVNVDLDVFGNAAALDVYKFLMIKLSNGETILSNLEKKTPLIEKQLTIPNLPFDEIKKGLLAIKEDNETTNKTCGKIKQVYFPVDHENYHLLSVLSPSNLIFKLKERINIMRFSDEAKEVRNAKKNNRVHEQNLSEIYGLSVIGYGGTKPQNISVLNSQNGGEAYLLSSTPPVLKSRAIQPPKTNFFTNTLWAKAFKEDFEQLERILSDDSNNIHIRNKRDWIVRNTIYQIADRLWMVRRLDKGWSDSESFQSLPKFQKIWLDQQYKIMREEDLEWLGAIKNELALWFLKTAKSLMKNKNIALGDNQLNYFKSIIDDCEEALR